MGVVLKKQDKWRMIMHLSAPAGYSISDSILSDDFAIHYASIDDAVKLLLSLRTGAKNGEGRSQGSIQDDTCVEATLGTAWHACSGTACST